MQETLAFAEFDGEILCGNGLAWFELLPNL